MSRGTALRLAAGGLGVAGAALGALAATTARRPEGPVPGRDGYFARWRELHGGYDPRTGSAWLRGWLTGVHAVAVPLARRGVQPDVVTVSSVWLAGLVVALAEAGGPWRVASGAGIVVSGLLDNLDGCLAVLEDRTTRWGYVLDSAVDRVSDTAYVVAAVAVGCPVPLAAALGFSCLFLEYVRARAGNAGGDGVGRVTMAERPTRVLVLAPTVLLGGLLPAHAPVLSTAGPALLLAMTVVSTGQLAAAVHRQLRALPPGAAHP